MQKPLAGIESYSETFPIIYLSARFYVSTWAEPHKNDIITFIPARDYNARAMQHSLWLVTSCM